MRNLKRALSLGLAAVMVMGMMIVGTSAKSYTDSDKIENQVAVEVLGEIGAMVGNEDGSFAPDRVVTRAEMAVLLTRILYGNNLNVDQFKGLNTFTDVPDWAEGFVNLCASLGIVAGRGDGIFDPNATVTTAEASLMLSRALGYFKNPAEFGSDWALSAVKRATQAGIIGGDMVLQANEGLTRDDVAQMTFNTLTKAVPVQYNELLDVYYNENQGIIYALEFNYLQTLGYTNFGLVYKTDESTIYGRPATTWGIGSYNADGQGTASGIEKAQLTDEGGLIASRVRMLDKDQIITVANTPDYVYSDATDEKDVYADLGATVCNSAKETYTWTTFINGKEVQSDIPTKNSTEQYQFTDKGSVTEIYIDDYDQTVTVVEINYYLGQVAKVNEDDKTISVKELSPEAKLNDDTFATTEFAEDDYVVFTVDYNDDEDYYICELMAPETVTGEVVRVENDNDSKDTYIRLDSTTGDKYYYTSDNHMVYDVTESNSNQHPTLKEDYILYMTPAGYVLGFKPAEETVDQYLYVKDSDEHLSTWEAKVVLPDATSPVVEVKDQYKQNGGNVDIAWDDESLQHANTFTNIDYNIWKYSVNDSGVYTLTYVQNYAMENAEINNGEAYVNSQNDDTYFIVDKKTIFVDVEGEKAYTGYDEVPNVSNAKLAYVVDDGVAVIVFILDGDIYDKDSTYFFLTSDARETEKYDGDYYWEYQDAYVNGKPQKVMIAYDALVNYIMPIDEDYNNQPLQVGVLYKATKTTDEIYITEVEQVGALIMDGNNVLTAGDVTIPQYVGDNAFSVTNTNNNEFKYTTNDDTVFVLVEREPESVKDYENARDNHVAYTGDFKWSVSTGRIGDLKDSRLEDYVITYATVAKADKQTAELVYIYQITPDYVGLQYNVTVKGDNVVTTGTGSYDKGSNVTVTIKAAQGYEITGVTGASYTEADGVYTVVINNISSNVEINVTTQPIAETYTLTLKGANFINDGTDNATVWTGATSQITGTPVTEFGTTTAITFQIPEGANVTLRDDDITAGTYVLDNNEIATAQPKSMTFAMTSDVTVDSDTLAAVYGIHIGDGVELTKVANNSGTEIQPNVIGDVAYISAADAQKLTVKTTDADAVIAVAAGEISEATDKVTGTKAAAQELTLTAPISADVYLYAASKVDTSAITGTVKVGDTTINVQDYVKVGETLVTTITSPATNGTGVIADTTGSTLVGEDVASGYPVGNDDVALVAAFQVTLNDATVQASDGTALKTGDFVKKGDVLKSATAATGKGTAAMDTTAGNVFNANAYTGAALNADLTLSAAVKLDVNTTNSGDISRVYTVDAISGLELEISDGSADVYVLPNTVIQVVATDGNVTVTDGSDPVEVDESSAATHWAKLTVGVIDLVLGNDA